MNSFPSPFNNLYTDLTAVSIKVRLNQTHCLRCFTNQVLTRHHLLGPTLIMKSLLYLQVLINIEQRLRGAHAQYIESAFASCCGEHV
jgi:hypothetical protein